MENEIEIEMKIHLKIDLPVDPGLAQTASPTLLRPMNPGCIGISGQTIMKVLAAWWVVSILTIAHAADASTESKEDASSQAPTYELGQGLRLGNSGFTLGGYASAEYEDVKNADPRFSLSHLSMFLWWENASRLKFFSEIDSEDTVATRYLAVNGERRYLSLERFYFDYAWNDSLTLRAGKFLTPIGRWNLVHADPLVWTTSRPMITRDLFPDNATGAMALGSLPLLRHQTDYTLYASIGEDLHKDPAQDPFSEAYGVHFNVSATEDLQIGLSYASFAQTAVREEHKQLVGVDFIWARRGYELSGEVAHVASSKGPERVAKGGFVQAVVPLYDKLYGVTRVESLRTADTDRATYLGVLGLTYRSSRAVSFKLEYSRGRHNDIGAPEGILSSVSVLF